MSETFITAFKAIKKCGKHIQGSVSYSLTEKRLGGPIFNIDYYVNKAKIMEEMGADSFCIKDMAGIISPYDAYELVSALKANIKIPVHLHTHYTSGMASMAMLKGHRSRRGRHRYLCGPLCAAVSHPAVEPFIVTLRDTPSDTGLDLEKFAEINEYLESHHTQVYVSLPTPQDSRSSISACSCTRYRAA